MNTERTLRRQGGAADAGLRRALLELAHRHARSGKTYLATERYLKLMREHPGTLEGGEARQALLDIAQRYEAEGKRYHALSVYDKVATWLAAGKPSGSKDESPVLDERTRRPVTRTVAEEASGPVEQEASRRTHETKGSEGQNRGTMDEIPFVDLTEDVHMAQNFERLGQVHRVPTGILHQTVDVLAKLKE